MIFRFLLDVPVRPRFKNKISQAFTGPAPSGVRIDCILSSKRHDKVLVVEMDWAFSMHYLPRGVALLLDELHAPILGSTLFGAVVFAFDKSLHRALRLTR